MSSNMLDKVICLNMLAKNQIKLWEMSWKKFWCNSNVSHETYFELNIFCQPLEQFLKWWKNWIFCFQILVSIPGLIMQFIMQRHLCLTDDKSVKRATAFQCCARRSFICHTHSGLHLAIFKNFFLKFGNE